MTGWGRVLLELRSDFKRWGLPGGHQEVGRQQRRDGNSRGIRGDRASRSCRRRCSASPPIRGTRPCAFPTATGRRPSPSCSTSASRAASRSSIQFETLELGWFALERLAGEPDPQQPAHAQGVRALPQHRQVPDDLGACNSRRPSGEGGGESARYSRDIHMIARIWHGRVPAAKGDSYLEHMRTFAIPRFARCRAISRPMPCAASKAT